MFEKATEAQVSRAIVREFIRWFDDYIVSDVIVVGGGPSGLVAARDLANSGFKTLLIESNNYLGGGFWVGGYFMNTLTFRAPAEKILDEVKIPYKKAGAGLFTADGPAACSKLISAACDSGAKILNLTKFDDVVCRSNKVAGAVINWAPVSALPRQIACVDPIALESKAVIDATGHDATVCRSLERRGLLKVAGFGPMDVENSEEAVVSKTGEVYPGLLACGMAISSVYGIPRMGATFGGMLLSGIKAARETKKLLKKTGKAA